MKWYMKNGDNGDVVISTRVRLARNLCDYPFPVRLDKAGRAKVIEHVSKVLLENSDDTLKNVELKSLTPAQTVSLAERHLISPEFASSSEGRALLLSEDEDIGIMLCEEDHIRLQVMYAGLALDEAYETAEKIDSILEQHLDYAFDERIGYLTQCPTNLGTGLRASLLLHLPALSNTGHIPRLAATVAKLGLTLRGAYIENTVPVGDIYQLSNQVTLGISEQAALQNLKSIAMQIVSQENQAREALIKEERFIDRIYRAYGVLQNAHMISCNEFMQLASLVRLGASQGILDVSIEKLNELFTAAQPATLNANEGGGLSSAQRDSARAKMIREALN